MTKLLINYDALKNSCIQNLNNSISKLDEVINVFNNLSIPYNYGKRQSIFNIKSSVISKRNELVNIRNWIVNSNDDFNATISQLCSSTSKLSKLKFGKRKGI